ncbi:hypothetical protein FCV25MIE_15488 [Fagus crenata]
MSICGKEKLGKHTSSRPQLPLVLEANGEVAVRPQVVLDQRRRRNQQEVLVHWQGLSPADATWENLEFLRKQFLGYVLEDKDHAKEGGVVTVIREQFFRFHETLLEDQVTLASFHLEGEAQLWYQLLQQETNNIPWNVFKSGILARYGPTQFYDYFGELTKLQQSGTVKEYQTRFEQLLAKAGPLPSTRQVSCFISGLKENLKADVMAGRPANLTTAIGLARLYEARNTSIRRATSLPLSNRSGPALIREDGNSRPPVTVHQMSPTELKERRDKGLCYNCNDKFNPRHCCKKLFLIEACCQEEDGDMVMDIEAQEALESLEEPGISLHAISGVQEPETMRLRGNLHLVPTTILVDSGSTHNFISEKLATKVNLKPTNAKKI